MDCASENPPSPKPENLVSQSPKFDENIDSQSNAEALTIKPDENIENSSQEKVTTSQKLKALREKGGYFET